MLKMNEIYNMDCISGLKQMEDNSIDCCVTSPPYWGLRDYGVTGQIGQEPTPEEYTQKVVEVFREVRRVLKPEGTLWLNLGDSYCSTAPGTMGYPLFIKECSKETREARRRYRPSTPFGMKPKDLVGIPWMVAFALRLDGWHLRSDIIWSKPNPMPESVTDRPTKSHEYIFLLSKSAKYYYDIEAIKEPIKESSIKRLSQDIQNQKGSSRAVGKTNGNMKAVCKDWNPKMAGGALNIENRKDKNADGEPYMKRNKRTVWEVSTVPFSEAHFATFPPKLIEPCILAGCPENGIVIDPFMGSGTTGMVALQLRRNFIWFELNPEYIRIAEKCRLTNVQQRIV